MLTKRIIACLDVRDGRVVKGVQFRNHRDMGGILELAGRYADEGVDELVFYDITASSDGRVVDKSWVREVARRINIPFCVAGGIRSVDDAKAILNDGADKISVNSPALERPQFITEIAEAFGTQCVVVGIDSRQELDENGRTRYLVYQYTGDETKTVSAKRETMEWAGEAQERGAGEIVLNCMNNDGVKRGYDLEQLARLRDAVSIPLIASGGAGSCAHFVELFTETGIDGGLAASIFHSGQIPIPELKRYLRERVIKCEAVDMAKPKTPKSDNFKGRSPRRLARRRLGEGRWTAAGHYPGRRYGPGSYAWLHEQGGGAAHRGGREGWPSTAARETAFG